MKTGLALLVLYVAIIIVALIGEVKCIYKMINCDWENIGKSEILYTVGAFTGTGAIIGWFDIEDK